ncbi:STAS domain-containing protein [Candidatus Uabimicrobium sp. HlEnr_7]|uniref:STAS domain-containing protein n=1 Tax=Candidatus Uabimicrobium helgolandensis TaxID=3095367 RepID=UPI0035572F0C
MEFQITSELKNYDTIGDVAILSFIGSVDQKSMQIIEASISECYTKNIKFYIFDFGQTLNINSTGIGVLINITSQISMASGCACLINADKFKNLIETIGLSDRLPIVGNEEKAIEYIKGTL